MFDCLFGWLRECVRLLHAHAFVYLVGWVALSYRRLHPQTNTRGAHSTMVNTLEAIHVGRPPKSPTKWLERRLIQLEERNARKAAEKKKKEEATLAAAAAAILAAAATAADQPQPQPDNDHGGAIVMDADETIPPSPISPEDGALLDKMQAATKEDKNEEGEEPEEEMGEDAEEDEDRSAVPQQQPTANRQQQQQQSQPERLDIVSESESDADVVCTGEDSDCVITGVTLADGNAESSEDESEDGEEEELVWVFKTSATRDWSPEVMMRMNRMLGKDPMDGLHEDSDDPDWTECDD